MSTFTTTETAWCPGCGNFAILDCLKNALEELGLKPHEVLSAAGIGQAAKTPQYISANSFCGLHGRALPAAIAAKIVNPALTVIVNSGDGDSYGEGGNHFLHNIRRNVNIAHFVHDNQIYGLTKGQASPTTSRGHRTDAQPGGSLNEPLNPVLVALAAGAGFVARGFTGDREQLTDLMKQAIQHPGYALIDILQPCVSFNKINTFADYKARSYTPEDHDPSNLLAAMALELQGGEERMALGVLYRADKPDFHRRHPVLQDGTSLAGRGNDPDVVKGLIQAFV